jgi:hypothetical protein
MTNAFSKPIRQNDVIMMIMREAGQIESGQQRRGPVRAGIEQVFWKRVTP